jgi:hypothetical protein
VRVPTENKSDDKKDSFNKELERVLDQFSKYHMKDLIDVNAEIWRENILKPAIGNVNLHEISNDNGVIVVSFAT